MIKTGDKIPSMKLMVATPEGPREADTAELLGRGKVVLFAVPGAFTPTCSSKHLPGFVKLAPEFKAKGVDKIVCMAVNDAYVMGAWGKDQKVGDTVVMLADGAGAFTKAFGTGARPCRAWHGPAQPAFCSGDRGWRGDACGRRGAGRV